MNKKVHHFLSFLQISKLRFYCAFTLLICAILFQLRIQDDYDFSFGITISLIMILLPQLFTYFLDHTALDYDTEKKKKFVLINGWLLSFFMFITHL